MKEDVFDKIGKLFKENPKYFGVFVLAIGIFIIAASFLNWDWIFKGHSFNSKKIEGTANLWGRGFARLKFGLGGLACIILGIILIIIG